MKYRVLYTDRCILKGLVGVKMEDNTHAAGLLRQLPSQVTLYPAVGRQRSATTGRLKAWTLNDLPKGCNIDDIFKLISLPTYIRMIGHHKQPFCIPDEDDLKAMQAIFNHLYQALQEYTIKIGTSCPVFVVVSL
jgi:hypothetical protein